jgi:hypothetical protein
MWDDGVPERIRLSGLWIGSLQMGGISGASERDRTFDLLIKNQLPQRLNLMILK